uniref:DUF2508 family protein n=1 Tax=Meloidogyne hapla TaxID=6305 RepID=A0A1I8BZR9_MELHA
MQNKQITNSRREKVNINTLSVDVADDDVAYVADFVEQAVDRCLQESKCHAYLNYKNKIK